MVAKAGDEHHLQGCSGQSSSSGHLNDIKEDTKMVVIRSRARVVLSSSSVGVASEYEFLSRHLVPARVLVWALDDS
jgi:hypothetical protein